MFICRVSSLAHDIGPAAIFPGRRRPFLWLPFLSSQVFPYKVCPRTSMIYLCGGSDLSADFLHFGASPSDFPSKSPFKKCFKIVFFSLWRRDPVLELQFPTPLRVVLLCFATQYPQIALEWLRQGCFLLYLHA